MVDVNPEIWNNPTLGAQSLPFLDEVTRQEQENLSAQIEGREPLLVVRVNRHPGAVPSLRNSQDDGIRLVDPATGNEFDDDGDEDGPYIIDDGGDDE